MINLVLLTLLAFTLKEPSLDKAEAKEAFLLINLVRTNPEKFQKEFSFLKEYKKMPRLLWNDTLAEVAEAKALDMARNNYFAHVDGKGFGMNYYINQAGYKLDSACLVNPRANRFESLNAGGLTGKEAVKMLLIDDGVPSLGHRKHLLGIDPWSATLYDIGIGFVRSEGNTAYKTYTCILIAKHK